MRVGFFFMAVCLFILSSVCSLTIWILNPACCCEICYSNPTVKLSHYSKTDFIALRFALLDQEVGN